MCVTDVMFELTQTDKPKRDTHIQECVFLKSKDTPGRIAHAA